MSIGGGGGIVLPLTNSLYVQKVICRIMNNDSQSRGPMFKTAGWFQDRLSLSSF